MKRSLSLCAGFVLAAAAILSAQADPVDALVRAEMTRQRIPGLSLAVLKDGKVIKVGGYGLADRSRRVAATPETVYKIGSVSKQFIAAGIMLLLQEGKLRLDDPVSKFLDDTPATWDRITLRHLLTHTSGIVREAPGFDWRKAQPDADVVRSAYSLPLRFAPGEKWEYSNTPYFALAEVIRRLSGQPWEQYLTEKVFTPLGMSTTGATNMMNVLANRARGYSDNDRLLDAPDWEALRPSGAFFSTVLDLAKWDAALYTERILTESSRRQMWTPVRLNDGSTYPYGFGWQLRARKGHREVSHGGGLPGFGAHLARFPDDRLTVILLVNLDDNDVEGIAAGIANLYLPSP